jgi:hypothetical protein
MNIYKINTTQSQISFKKTIKADTYENVRRKFDIEINKNNISFPYIQPEIEITKNTKRY